MCDKELLVGYLYDELAPAERSKFEAHLFACPDCREEIAALRATRAHLAQWTPPESHLGFQFVRAGDGPVGWLTHHAVHDAAAWAFLERLFSVRGVRWLSAREVFSYTAAAHG